MNYTQCIYLGFTSLYSSSLLDSYVESIAIQMYDDCSLVPSIHRIEYSLCISWLSSHGHYFRDFPDTLPSYPTTCSLQLVQFLPLTYISLDHVKRDFSTV